MITNSDETHITRDSRESRVDSESSCIISVVNLSFGLASLIISLNSLSANGECSNVWTCIFLLGIVQTLAGIVALYSCTQHNTILTLLQVLSVCFLVWAIVLRLYEVHGECRHFYESKYSDLWNMLTAQMWLLFTTLIVSCSCILVVCGMKFSGSDYYEH